MFNNLTEREWLTLSLLIVILVGAVVGFLWMAVGLFRARSLIRREFSAYFLSPIAYVVLVVFLFVTGDLFATTLGLLTAKGPVGTESPMQTMFGDKLFWLVFLFIPPLLTMRLFAEERSSGTLEMLMTAPLRDWQVVLCKYLACLAFYTVMWLPTLLYLPALLGAQMPILNNVWTVDSILFAAGLATLLVGLMLLLPHLGTGARLMSLLLIVVGSAAAGAGGWLHYHAEGPHLFEIPVMLDPYPVLWTYAGMFLVGAMFLAIGLLISSLVRNQMVAAILALAVGLVFIGSGFWRPELAGTNLYNVVYFFSVPLHFDRAFTRGLLDTRPLILYGSTALFCLFLTVRSLEARRWQ
ncbi:MAG TPA: ABC transporter permease [Gemmataceae bacterium]|jgi:ABC-type transport system involved in multi-copper enzyme maturation permease subunit